MLYGLVTISASSAWARTASRSDRWRAARTAVGAKRIASPRQRSARAFARRSIRGKHSKPRLELGDDGALWCDWFRFHTRRLRWSRGTDLRRLRRRRWRRAFRGVRCVPPPLDVGKLPDRGEVVRCGLHDVLEFDGRFVETPEFEQRATECDAR